MAYNNKFVFLLFAFGLIFVYFVAFWKIFFRKWLKMVEIG